MYLERVIETSWELWKVSDAQTVTTTTQTAAMSEPAQPISVTPNDNQNPAPSSAAAEPTPAEASSGGKPLKEFLEILVKEGLRKWIDEHDVTVKSTNKLTSKTDLVSAILSDPLFQKPSEAEVNALKQAVGHICFPRVKVLNPRFKLKKGKNKQTS